MSIPFEQVCENTCSIDLSVTANLAPSFQSPFVIGSSSFVSLIFTVINIGIDPAYLPVLKIPLGTKRILQTPPNCVKYEGEKPFLRCQLPGPINSGIKRTISVNYDVSKLVGGQTNVLFENFEVFSESAKIVDINPANNRNNYELVLKSEIDLVLSTSIQSDSLDIKENDKFLIMDFTQFFQIRNRLRTPIQNVQTEISVPTHYAQKELVQYQASMIQLNDGTQFNCTQDMGVRREPVGKSSLDLPTRIDCVQTAGVRCIEINCPRFNLMSMTDSATLIINLKLIPDNLDKFQLPDLLEEGISIASLAKVSVDPRIQDLIEDQNQALDEIFSITKFIDLPDPKDPGILGIAIPVVVAVAILLILIGIFCFFGCFKRMSPEEIAKQEGKQDSGFEKNNESTKMLDEVER